MKSTPIPKIAKRLSVTGFNIKLGQKVLVTGADGKQFFAEVYEFHQQIKNWIIKVKRVDDDGKVTIEEVADLVIEAVVIAKDIAKSGIWKVIGQFFKNIFKKR